MSFLILTPSGGQVLQLVVYKIMYSERIRANFIIELCMVVLTVIQCVVLHDKHCIRCCRKASCLSNSWDACYASVRMHKHREIQCCLDQINPLMGTQNRKATDHDTAIRWLVPWPLIGGLLHLVQRGRVWAGCGCTKCNSPPITGTAASVPTSYYLMRNYNCQCPLKG